MECDVEEVDFDGQKVFMRSKDVSISLKEIGNRVMTNNEEALVAAGAHSSPVSPPPFMVGMAEVEVDKETGKVELIDYAAVVDCGTVVNPNLARIQTEGGIAQGIGMALYENVVYNEKGQCLSNSFMQYKIPSRMDVGDIRVEFESSYEPTGPFGAKSIGEVVINTPSPAIAHAVYNATGVQIKELPITSEKYTWECKTMKISLILLAAGDSRRFGSNKLLYELHGKPMYRYSVDEVAKLDTTVFAEKIVVSQYDEILDTLSREGYLTVRNTESYLGISHSIQLGLAASEEEAWCFLVADQPYLKAETLERFVEAFQKVGRAVPV